MGISSKSSSSTTNTSNTGTSTTTPNVPQWGVDSLQNLNKMIEGLAGTDPSSFVTGPSDLQTQAFTDAGSLGDWLSGISHANDILSGVAGAGPSAAGLTTATSSDATPTSATPTSAGYTSADFTTAGPATLANFAPQEGAAQAKAAGIFDNGIAKYLNPELESVVGTSLAGYDKQAGQTAAANEAAGARNGAFGGSRFGLQTGEEQADSDLGRANLEATLRSNAYNTATGLANQDADRRNSTSQFNAGQTNTVNQENSSRLEQELEHNADATNNMAQFNAGQENNNSEFNAGQANNNSQFNAGQANAASEFNAGQANTMATQNADRNTNVSEFNTTAANNNSQFNANERDADLNRQTGVAGLLQSLATALNSGEINDINTEAALGGTQRDIAQSKATAPISLAQTIAQLLSMNQLPLLTGTTTNSSSSGTSTTNQTQTPSLWSQVGNGIQTAANLAALFG
jgi:hypothetical protein